MADFEYVVNKSGKNLNVYNAPSWEPRKKIGTILNRETFLRAAWTEQWPEILFRNSAGQLVRGFGDRDEWEAAGDAAESPLTDYPYTRNPDTLYLRKARKIYRPNGTLYMTLAAGKRVKIRTQSSDPNGAGSSMKWLMIIDSYETTSGNYSKIDGGHGFIDMGLTDTGSGYKYIPVYGSW